MPSSPFPPPEPPSPNGPSRLPREARISAALIDLAGDIVDGTTTLPPTDTDKAPTQP